MVFNTRFSMAFLLISIFFGAMFVLVTPSGFLALSTTIFVIILNLIIYIIERKKYNTKSKWFKGIKDSFKVKKYKYEEENGNSWLYWKFSALYAILIYLSWWTLYLFDAYVLRKIIPALLTRKLIIGLIYTFLLCYLTFLAIVKIEKKAKNIYPFSVSVKTIFIFLILRQIVGVIITLARGDPWSFWYLVPNVFVFEIIFIFIIPWIYYKWRKK